MSEELKKDTTLDNQYVVFMFLVIGLAVLFVMFDVVFFNDVWWAAALSCASMMIATVVYIQLDIRNKVPWLWSLGTFLVIPVLYFIIVSLTG